MNKWTRAAFCRFLASGVVSVLTPGLSLPLAAAGIACALPSSSRAEVTLLPSSSQIRYTGRFDLTNPDKPAFDWPACVIEAAFTGKSLTLLISGGNNDFNVFIDGARLPNLVLKNGVANYPIASSLSPGAHRLRLTKRTEGSSGTSVFSGLMVDDDQGAASLPPRPAHRILFIGDSYSAGYGTEANTVSCGDKRPYDNADTAFGPLAARALDAEYSVQAVSGIGMVHNYGDGSPQSAMPFPPYFDRTLFGNAQLKFDYSQWIPEVIIIALGNNDFSTAVKPSQEQYSSAYRAFHATVRAAYPQAQILCVAFGDDALQKTYISAIVETLTQQGDSRLHYFQMPSLAGNATGCDYHPGLAGQKKFAEALVPEIQKWLTPAVSLVSGTPRKHPLHRQGESGPFDLLGRLLTLRETRASP